MKAMLAILTVRVSLNFLSSNRVSLSFLMDEVLIGAGIAKVQQQSAKRQKATSFISSGVGVRSPKVAL